MSILPLTVRRSIELMGLYFLGMLLIVGKDVITPLILAFFLSIMLLPVHRFFMRKKVPETLSIIFCLLMLATIIGLLVWFFSAQISGLISDFPVIKKNIQLHISSLAGWIQGKTGLSTSQQAQLINDQNEKVLDYAGKVVSGAAASITGIFIFIGLLPIYIFLMLFYKNLLVRFIFLWFPQDNHAKVEEVIRETQVIIKSYLVGLLIQITYITILLGTILLLFGIKHAILIGAIFAILNLIPYVGALIGNLIGVILTVSSTQEIYPIIIVLGTIAFVQFLDNNILMPRIVGSKVKINALATIVGVIVAGAVAGIAGMFLSLPIIAVLKIVFDRTNNLRQWGVILGDERPERSPMQWPVFRKSTKKVREKLEIDNNIDPTDDAGNESATKHEQH